MPGAPSDIHQTPITAGTTRDGVLRSRQQPRLASGPFISQCLQRAETLVRDTSGVS